MAMLVSPHDARAVASGRRVGRTLAVIVLLALALGAGKLWRYPPTLALGETSQWWEIVSNVRQGHGYVACFADYFPPCGSNATAGPTAAREPFPVLLFVAVAGLTHDSLLTAGLAELTINLAVLPAVFLLGRRLAGQRAALLAALLWALYLPAWALVPQVSGELPATFWVGWALVVFLRASDTDTARPRDWLLVGLCLGLAALSRSATVAIAPALALVLLLRRRPGAAALVTIACGLTLLPWLLRNELAFGRPVLGSTLAGYNLYRENYQLPTADYLRFVGPIEGGQAIHALLTQPALRGAEDEAQLDDAYRAAALRVITAEPVRYAVLSVYRIPMLLLDWGVPEAYGARPNYVEMAQQAGLLLAAGVGLARWRRTWPLWASAAVYTVAHLLVISRLRLLIPVMPLVVVLSAVGGVRLLSAVGEVHRSLWQLRPGGVPHIRTRHRRNSPNLSAPVNQTRLPRVTSPAPASRRPSRTSRRRG